VHPVAVVQQRLRHGRDGLHLQGRVARHYLRAGLGLQHQRRDDPNRDGLRGPRPCRAVPCRRSG
jgi:hypothetical protein